VRESVSFFKILNKGPQMINLLNAIFCYIDPGNTSYIVQIIIGAVVAGGFYFKSIWFRIRAFFGRFKK
jgi:hypothetical protein